MKNKIRTTKNFVSKHKTALAVGATAGVCLAIHMDRVRAFNEFLTEHELFDTFYIPLDQQ
jgi:hypothetical protein